MNPMYVQLLEAVLADEDAPASGPRSQGPLAGLLRLRHTVEQHAARGDPGWALQAVADQLAYDAALVRLARRRSIAVDIHSFDIPERGRAGLEQALRDKGVHLPDGSAPTIDPVVGDR
jgi:hypothetical protein